MPVVFREVAREKLAHGVEVGVVFVLRVAAVFEVARAHQLDELGDVLVLERVAVGLAELDDLPVHAGVLDVGVRDERLGAGTRPPATSATMPNH